MKSLRILIFFSTIRTKNYKSVKMVFTLLFTTLIFYSCSNEVETINNSGTIGMNDKLEDNNLKNQSKVVRPNFLQENVNTFSQTIFLNYGSLDDALSENLYVVFNEQTMHMLNNAQSENDLKIVFEAAGIANSQDVLNILKNIVTVQQTFIADNPNFYSLTKEQQIEYLNSSIEVTKNNFILSNPPVTPTIPFVTYSGCAHTFNLGVDRCIGDFGNCAAGAILGTLFGGYIPGLIAAGQCMVSKYNCDKRIKRDFKDCQAQEYVRGVPGPESILTLHCTTDLGTVIDSCWTTYNGKYFGRVNM